MENPRLPDLFLAFLRLGIGAFGGPAMVVYIRALAVSRMRWIEEKVFDEGVALCQSIPGATAMQMAGYVGLKSRGIPGALASFAGFGLPPFLLMAVLSVLYLRYRGFPAAVSLFAVLQVIVVSLTGNATLLLGRGLFRKPAHMALAFLSAFLFFVGTNPFLVILLGASLGALILRKGSFSAGTVGQGPLFHWKPVSMLLFLMAAGLGASWLVNPRLFQLGVTMAKIDCFAFGGGFAALPLMLHEVVDVRGWMTGPTFMDGIALGQITPGPIIITATFVGFMVEGIRGAVVATCAVFAPSFIILVIAAPLFERLKGSPFFVGAASGAFATFLGLLLFMTVKFATLVPWDFIRVAIALAAFAALLKKVDTFYVVIAGAVLSFFVFR